MGEQESIQQQFIREIAGSIFEQSVNGKDTEEKCFFKLRFDPENEKLDNQNKNNNDIVSLMNQKLGYSPRAIQRFQKEKVIQAIVKKYEQEMEADQIDINRIRNPKRGDHDVWKRVYSWLWDKQFPRYLWETLRKESDEKNQDWIRFIDDSLVSSERGLVVRTPKKEPKTIPINQSLDLVINVDADCCNHHLLLFNRGLTDFHLICPTEIFAPKSQIEEIPWSMPTEGSIANRDEWKFKFDTTGTEEFLGIVIEQPLELEWLKLSENLQFEPKHLVKLWEQLEKNQNWRSFYQSFEVIEAP